MRSRLTAMLCAVPDTNLVGEAAGVQEAIRGILATHPDLVLLDLSLEEGTGFDVLKAVLDQEPGLDVYMLSNFATEPYRRRAARLGARGFFDKTTDFERVRDLLAQRAAPTLIQESREP